MKHVGGCHCGRIGIEFMTEAKASRFEVLACQCSFCRKHGSRAIADPKGRLLVDAKVPDTVSAYEFGLRTATYLVCRNCGVYVAALTCGEPRRGIVMVNALQDQDRFTRPARPVWYDHETREERIRRRLANWTPATVRYAEG